MEDINNFIDLSAYQDVSAKISVEYSTDIEAEMQLFYTTDFNETKISFFKGNSELMKILLKNACGAYNPK